MNEKPYMLEVADRDAIATAIRRLRGKSRRETCPIVSVVRSPTGMKFVVTLVSADAIPIVTTEPPLDVPFW